MTGPAHGLAALDLAGEEHALARGHRALRELLRRERALEERGERARRDAVALDEVPEHARVERRALAPSPRPAEAHVAVGVEHDLAVGLHRAERLVEDRLEGGVGAELNSYLKRRESACTRSRAAPTAIARVARARRRGERRRDHRARHEEVDDEVLREVEREARRVGDDVDRVRAGSRALRACRVSLTGAPGRCASTWPARTKSSHASRIAPGRSGRATGARRLRARRDERRREARALAVEHPREPLARRRRARRAADPRFPCVRSAAGDERARRDGRDAVDLVHHAVGEARDERAAARGRQRARASRRARRARRRA